MSAQEVLPVCGSVFPRQSAEADHALDLWQERHDSVLGVHRGIDEVQPANKWAEKGITAAHLLGLAATQAVGFTKAPSALALPLAAEVYTRVEAYDHAHLPLAVSASAQPNALVAASIAGGIAYGSWNYMAARLVGGGVGRFPRLFDAINRKANKKKQHTDKLSSVLPGLDATETEKGPARTAADHLVCGATIYGVGMAPYMGSAAIQNQSPAERRTLSKKLGLSACVFAGSLATGVMSVAYTADVLQGGDSKLAAQILETSSNKELLVGIAWIGFAGRVGYLGAKHHITKQVAKYRKARRPELAPSCE